MSVEWVVPTIVKRLENLLEKSDVFYDLILILDDTNDLAFRPLAEYIFQQGLKRLHDLVLNDIQANTKLVAMTILEVGSYPLGHKTIKRGERGTK